MTRSAAAPRLAPLHLLAATSLIAVGTAFETGCNLLLGDPDRIIALEIVGPTKYTLPLDDTLYLVARARSANGDSVPGAEIVWAVLDTGTVGIGLDSATGRVIGLALGHWRVQARVEEIRSDSIPITVVAPAP